MMQRIQHMRGAVLACLAALILAVGVAFPQAAFASAAVYTATTVPTYENPATGVIEDAGGASNQALGASMVSGTTYGNALVEVDSAGNVFLTLRFGLIDQISDMNFEYSTDGGNSFTAVARDIMQIDDANNLGDFRFQVPNENVVVRVNMDVIPMGRAVVFFVQLSNLQEGNLDTFIQSVDATAPAAGAPAVEPAVEEPEPATPAAADGTSSADADAAAEEPAPAADGASTTKGVREFDADGNEIDGAESAQKQGSEGLNIPVVAGIVVAAVIVVGGAAFFVGRRSNNSSQSAAAAAAAAAAPSSVRSGPVFASDAASAAGMPETPEALAAARKAEGIADAATQKIESAAAQAAQKISDAADQNASDRKE